MSNQKKIRNLIDTLKKANKAYYQEAQEIMSNKEYDALYDELLELEQQTGIVYSDSPTQNVGYEVISKLPKEQHPSPMLSLDKTKNPNDLVEWLSDKEGILSWKLDGLTCVLTYKNGELEKAVTRGNGIIGEVITSNAKQFVNVPLKIPFKEELVVRGEALISYKDFEEINENLSENEKYKNPRNLASGSIRQLDSKITQERNVRLILFELVSAKGAEINTIEERFEWLESLGFEVVQRQKVTKLTVKEHIEKIYDHVKKYAYPSDGLVLTYNDYQYGISLGTTSKFPKHSIAFKWQDETAETTLLNVVWNTTRTGAINPVAVFEPVELEGTTVEKATLNNVSFIRKMEIGIGDILSVYKANMIIPTIDDNLTRSNTLEIPKTCPACGGKTRIVKTKDSAILYCTNPDCKAKRISKFENFVSREGMNIDGLSSATLEFLINKEWIVNFHDLYDLELKRDAWIHYPGFGEASVDKILKAIEISKKVKLENFITAQGIEGIGKSQSKVLAREFGDWDGLSQAFNHQKNFSYIQGFGEATNTSIWNWYRNGGFEEATILSEIVEFISGKDKQISNTLEGKVFVITGDLILHKNRKELQQVIENAGGKVSGSVSSKTSFLINNDSTSGSSKNKKAKELGVKIITEEEFLQML